MKGGNSYYTLTCFITRHYTQSAVNVPDDGSEKCAVPDKNICQRKVVGELSFDFEILAAVR